MRRVLLAALAAGVLVSVIVLLTRGRGGPPRPRPPKTPLTDVAARPRPVDLSPDDSPARRLAQLRPSSQPVAPPLKVIPPREMPDPSRPPQWTRRLAAPRPLPPPDPSVPPPMAVDPDRGRRGHEP